MKSLSTDRLFCYSETMEDLGIDYNMVFHTLPGYYLVLANDAPKYTIVEANQSHYELARLMRKDAIGKPFHSVFPVARNKESREGAATLDEAMRHSATTGKTTHIGVTRYDMRTADGTFIRRIWDSTVYPIEHDGKIVALILSAEDITERIEADDYTRQRLKHLEHLVEINKSKDEFISITSHQLRTPATGVKQYLGMLRDGMFGELSDMQADILERAYESNERQLRIVTDMLKVAQVDAGKVVLHREMTDINRLVHYMIKDTTGVFEKRAQTLVFKPLPRDVALLIDGEIVRMVVENILDNASKYTPEGGYVEVKITETKTKIKIRIADRGVGVSDDNRDQLFKKFVRIDNILSTKVGGTGLGLYWAKRSINLHGGDIVHKPNKPSGSIFEIILPKE